MKKILAVGLFLAGLLFYFADINYVNFHEVGMTWNPFTGELGLQTSGWYITPPWVIETSLDTRPQRVCITSATQSYNCRLVQFVPSEYKVLAQIQGFKYYWWANRISFNFGYQEEYRGFRDILRGYAYSTKSYPFIKVIQE